MSYSYSQLKTKHMTKEQMIEIILNEERELYSTYRESLDAFGTNDAATTHAITRWVVIANLLQTLKINDEKTN